jgi:hypothetical protein
VCCIFVLEIDFWVERNFLGFGFGFKGWGFGFIVEIGIQVGFRRELGASLITGVGEKVGERGELFECGRIESSYEFFGFARLQGFGEIA